MIFADFARLCDDLLRLIYFVNRRDIQSARRVDKENYGLWLAIHQRRTGQSLSGLDGN